MFFPCLIAGSRDATGGYFIQHCGLHDHKWPLTLTILGVKTNLKIDRYNLGVAKLSGLLNDMFPQYIKGECNTRLSMF